MIIIIMRMDEGEGEGEDEQDKEDFLFGVRETGRRTRNPLQFCY